MSPGCAIVTWAAVASAAFPFTFPQRGPPLRIDTDNPAVEPNVARARQDSNL
jgi:hypothetical protein